MFDRLLILSLGFIKVEKSSVIVKAACQASNK